MQMPIESGAITPLCHYGDLGQCCPAHKQKNVGVACFSGDDDEQIISRALTNYACRLSVVAKYIQVVY